MKISLKKIEFVIFDCDGVILDTNKIKTEAFKKTLNKYPKEKIDKLIAFHKENGGVSRKIKFEYFFNNIINDSDPKKVNDSLKKFKRISFQKLLLSRYIKGVLKFINILKKNNIKIFIVSGAIQAELRKIFLLKNKNRYFYEILGTPKNKIDNIQIILDKYSLDINKGIFFGDSYTDYISAKKFKIKFIFVKEKSEWTNYKKIRKMNKINNFLDINV